MTVVPYSDNANSSTDSAQVASNTTAIAANATTIGQHTSGIAVLDLLRYNNTQAIQANAAAIVTNTTDIANNANDITSVGATLAAMNTATTASIATNTANIATNASAISSNASDIATHTAALSQQQITNSLFNSSFLQNANDIATNTTAIASNATNLSNAVVAIQASLIESGTVAQVKYVQTRDRYLDSGGNHVGLALTNSGSGVDDVHVDKLDVTITPKAAENKIIVEFVVNFNVIGETADYGFIVKRFDGTTRTTLAQSQDNTTDYFTVIATPLHNSDANKSSNAVVKIVDENSLSVATTYELYARVTDSFSSSATSIFYLNGPAGEHPYDAGGGNSSREGMLSVATLTEIRA